MFLLGDTLDPMKRDATQTIWRTVVFAGAMLGTPACTSKKPANTTPSNTTTTTTTTETAPAGSETATPAPAGEQSTTAEDPCGGERPRGADDGGGVGRGFVLS